MKTDFIFRLKSYHSISEKKTPGKCAFYGWCYKIKGH